MSLIPSIVVGNFRRYGILKFLGIRTGTKVSTMSIHAGAGDYDHYDLFLPTESVDGFLKNTGGQLSFAEAGGTGTSTTRQAHGSSVAGVNLTLTWDTPFINTNYAFVYTAYSVNGGAAEVKFISKSATNIIIKTLVNTTINAIAVPF